MKLIRGKELSQLIAEARERLDDGAARDPEHQREHLLELIRRVCEAVAFAHSRGVVHRDLKPANIMVGRFGEVYVMDWGIARVRTPIDEVTSIDTPPMDWAETRHGSILGTPQYMAPEQARGESDEVGAPSDQFSIGLILQEMVTLRPARRGGKVKDVLARAERAERESLDAYPGDDPIPRELRAIVARATDPDPARRYDGVEALADELQRFLLGKEVEAAPDTSLQHAARWLAQHRRAALGGLLVLLVVAAASMVTTTAVVRERHVVVRAHERERALERLVDEATTDARALDLELLAHERALDRMAGAASVVLARGEALGAGGAAGPSLPQPLTKRLEGLLATKSQLSTKRALVTLPGGARFAVPPAPNKKASAHEAQSYRAALASQAPVWLAARHGEVATLTCSVAVRSTSQKILGVVAIELMLEDTTPLLQRDGAAWAGIMLLDAAGGVVAKTSHEATPPASVVEAVTQQQWGLVELPSRTFAVAPLDVTGWALVATLPAAGAKR
jgi:hypothetical protein